MKSGYRFLLAATALLGVLGGLTGLASADGISATTNAAVEQAGYDMTPFAMVVYHRQAALPASQLDEIAGPEAMPALEARLGLEPSDMMTMVAQNKVGARVGAPVSAGTSSPLTYQAGIMVTPDHARHGVSITANWQKTSFSARSVYAADGALHFDHAVIVRSGKSDIVDKSSDGTTFGFAKTPSVEYRSDWTIGFNKRMAIEIAAPDGHGYDIIVIDVQDPSRQMVPDNPISTEQEPTSDPLDE